MKKLVLKHVTNGCFWTNFAIFFFKFCIFLKMPENQLLTRKQVTLALMVLFGLFHLYKLVQAQTGPKKFCTGLLILSVTAFIQCAARIGDTSNFEDLCSGPVWHYMCSIKTCTSMHD